MSNKSPFVHQQPLQQQQQPTPQQPTNKLAESVEIQVAYDSESTTSSQTDSSESLTQSIEIVRNSSARNDSNKKSSSASTDGSYSSQLYSDDYTDYEDEGMDQVDGADLIVEDESEEGYETDSALFSHLVDFIANKSMSKPKFANHFDQGLDLTPVSEKRSSTFPTVSATTSTSTSRQYDYSQLNIESVHLSSSQHHAIHQPAPSSVNTSRLQQSKVLVTPQNQNQNLYEEVKSTLQIKGRVLRQDTPEAFNRGELDEFGRPYRQNVSLGSDTDSSLSGVNCCQMPFKLKWY